MSLQGIFDPVVRKYFEKKFGVGSAVDDGYYIEWDGNTEGRDSFELNANGIAIRYVKVSNLIIDAERLEGSTATNEETVAIQLSVLPMEGLSILVDSSNPYIFSGKAGEYSYDGFTATLPSDGTYFVGMIWNIRKLYRSAKE